MKYITLLLNHLWVLHLASPFKYYGIRTLEFLGLILCYKNNKFYQTSSSEMFGDVEKKKKQLLLILRSYAISKSFFALHNYRTHIICLLHLEFYLIMNLL